MRRFRSEVGGLDWCAIQDWMCEPHILQKTGATVLQHQERSIDSYLELRGLDDTINWCPVLQGWTIADYHSHVEQYARRGVDLKALPIVGVGSVCRRQATDEIAQLVRGLSAHGLRLHGFGMKTNGLAKCIDALTSSDSMAWSFAGRRDPPLPGCTTHKNCANCLKYALLWRERLLKPYERSA